jgi:hypothetical protein
MARVYATYFDHRYLPRGLALYDSIRKWDASATLWALCLSRKAFDHLNQLRLPGLKVVALETLEEAAPELLEVKHGRSPVEYYFTLGPTWLVWVLAQNSEIDSINYVDADMFFFNDPSPVFLQLANASVGLVPHLFQIDHERQHVFGKYNVSFVHFKRDEDGLRCLKWWKQRCLEWCKDEAIDGKYADQKYLDAFEGLSDKVRPISMRGVSLAPWNLSGAIVTKGEQGLEVDGSPLFIYHFHGLKRVLPKVWDTGLWNYQVALHGLLRKEVYKTYLKALARRGQAQADPPLRGSVDPRLCFHGMRMIWRHARRAWIQRAYLFGP